MSKKSGECRIEPEFKSHRRRHVAKPTIQHVEEPDYSDEEDDIPTTSQSGGIMSTLREYKFTILLFAVIIILLICAIVWLVGKNDKQVRVEGTGPPTNTALPKPPAAPPATTPAATTTQTPIPNSATVPPNNQQTPATPTTTPQTPATTPANDDALQSNEEIIQTVDDNELNKYMNVGIESN